MQGVDRSMSAARPVLAKFDKCRAGKYPHEARSCAMISSFALRSWSPTRRHMFLGDAVTIPSPPLPAPGRRSRRRSRTGSASAG